MKKLTYTDVRNSASVVTEMTLGEPMKAQYVLGAMEVILASVVADIPKHKQMEVIASLESLAKRVALL